MTISNINITASNGTHLYPVKASIGEPTYDYIQCSPSEAEGIAVLRYIPSVAEIVAGEFYATSTPLISYEKSSVECTLIDVPLVNMYIAEDGLTDWFYVGKGVSTAGIIAFKVLPSDFSAGDSFFVKVEDVSTPTVFDIVEGIISEP